MSLGSFICSNEKCLRIAALELIALLVGLAYAGQRSYKRSEAAFRRAIALNLKLPVPNNRLSRLLVELGRVTEAVSVADESLGR